MTVSIGEVATFAQVEPSKAQVLKIGEETMEVYSAWEDYHGCATGAGNCDDCPRMKCTWKRRLLDECADVITATANLIAALGVDDFAPYMEACEKRNRERGRL